MVEFVFYIVNCVEFVICFSKVVLNGLCLYTYMFDDEPCCFSNMQFRVFMCSAYH